MPKLEPEVEFSVATFAHELAKYLNLTVCRPGAVLPRTPPRPFHQLLLLERSTALPKPCSRHANFTICSCLLAQGWQSTSMVSILNKRRCCWMLQLRPRSDFGRLMLLVPSYAFAPSFGSVTGGTEGNVGIYTTGV